MFNKNKNVAGFTLLEMMIAVSIFVVLIMLTVSIYMSYQRHLVRVQVKEEVLNESRVILDRLARDIRLSALDYSTGWPGNTAENELRLIKPDGNRVWYRFDNQAPCALSSGNCLLYGMVDEQTGAVEEWLSLSSAPLNFNNSKFYIYPEGSPFADNDNDGVFDYDIQPRVTIFFNIDSVAGQLGGSFSGQTTVSSRIYKR